MLYQYDGQLIDSIDLKALLISQGVQVADEVYARFKNQARLSKNPLECNTISLPDETVVQLTDLSFHMEYIGSILNWEMLSQLKYLPQLHTDFSLKISPDGHPAIFFKKKEVTPVRFIKPSGFYQQRTSSGLPFLGNAVLQGEDWLSFQLLWKCDYAFTGEPCQYCFSGGEIATLARKGKALPQYPTPADVAEMVEYAVVKEQCANSIQITGGSLFDSQAEIEIITNILEAINQRVGRNRIPGEIVVYVTPPKQTESIDRLFAAGADRVSCSLEIWDESLAARVMPGKMKYTGRQRHLDCLDYVSAKYGKNKACCNFIIGLEPLESLLTGTEYLAARGIAPIASVWIPFGRPVLNSMKAPGLSYFQEFKRGLAQIYCQYGVEPPGGQGLNVCMCRDVFLSKDSLQVLPAS